MAVTTSGKFGGHFSERRVNFDFSKTGLAHLHSASNRHTPIPRNDTQRVSTDESRKARNARIKSAGCFVQLPPVSVDEASSEKIEVQFSGRN